MCLTNISFDMIDSQKQNETINKTINKEWEYEIIKDDDRLKCPICKQVLIDPILHSLCGNTFCRSCIKKNDNCHLCEKPVLEANIIPAPNMIKEMICNLQVKCKQCNQEMSFEAFKNHKENCEFPCPFGCGNKVTISSIKEHAPLNCPKCVNKCCYSEYGCPLRVPGGDEYYNHLHNCNLAHFALYKMIKELNTRMNEMETKMENKMNQIVEKNKTKE